MVPMHVDFFDRSFVPLRLVSKPWQPCSFNEVSDSQMTLILLNPWGFKKKEPG